MLIQVRLGFFVYRYAVDVATMLRMSDHDLLALYRHTPESNAPTV